MNPLRRAGKRIVEALRGSSPAPGCPRCEPLRRENEALQQEMARLRTENQAQKEETARLRERVEEAHRAGKRQAAPFSKGPPKANPKKNGRNPARTTA